LDLLGRARSSPNLIWDRLCTSITLFTSWVAWALRVLWPRPGAGEPVYYLCIAGPLCPSSCAIPSQLGAGSFLIDPNVMTVPVEGRHFNGGKLSERTKLQIPGPNTPDQWRRLQNQGSIQGFGDSLIKHQNIRGEQGRGKGGRPISHRRPHFLHRWPTVDRHTHRHT
jgi:hypothetical protein